MRVCLFEDQHVESLEPLTLTRPAFDLLCGQTTLAHKQIRHFDSRSHGVLVGPFLEEVQRQERLECPVNDMTWLRADTTAMVNGRWLPPSGRFQGGEPCVGMIGNQVAFAVVPRETLTYCSPHTIDDCVEVWKQTLPHVEAGGRLTRYLWELVDWNGPYLVEDFAEKKRRPCAVAGPGVAIVGPREQLHIDPTAKVDPMVVVDTTGGPVVIDAEAIITAFTRLEGPCYIGPKSHILGAKIRSGTSIGPQCRIGGEVEASILLGHANKYHEGFLGHSYVGEWVNLGAGTHNSDLRNDYGPIVVTVAGERVETGRSKVGCFLGDHTKSGLGTLLNTGTSVGVFCNLLPCGGLLPKYVPSYCSVWNGALAEKESVENLLATARKAMTRRGYELSEERVHLYRELQSKTALERQRALREGEQRRLRRSA